MITGVPHFLLAGIFRAAHCVLNSTRKGQAMTEDRMQMDREWTNAHILAYFYNAFAFGSDGVLSEDEKREIVNCIREWLTDISDEDLYNALSSSLVWIGEDLESAENGEKVLATMNGIAGYLNELLKPNNGDADRRKYFLCDLVRLAVADGNFDDTEKAWIRATAEIFEIEFRI